MYMYVIDDISPLLLICAIRIHNVRAAHPLTPELESRKSVTACLVEHTDASYLNGMLYRQNDGDDPGPGRTGPFVQFRVNDCPSGRESWQSGHTKGFHPEFDHSNPRAAFV